MTKEVHVFQLQEWHGRLNVNAVEQEDRLSSMLNAHWIRGTSDMSDQHMKMTQNGLISSTKQKARQKTMARPRKNVELLPPEGQVLEPTKNTKEEIEAALARAVSGGSKRDEPIPHQPPQPQIEPTQPPAETDENQKTMEVPTPQPQEVRGLLDIDAEWCHKETADVIPPEIVEHIKGINEKIMNSMMRGEYSTEVLFRIMPNQPLPMHKIFDWYKARGFEVNDYRVTGSMSMPNSGIMDHSFKVSWASAR